MTGTTPGLPSREKKSQGMVPAEQGPRKGPCYQVRGEPCRRYPRPVAHVAVWAHRGCAEDAPENSLQAFADAHRNGADGIELDVRRCADGALVVHHDAVVPGLGPLCGVPLADLPSSVPLLGEALEACGDLTINVEIKNAPVEPGFEQDQGIATDVARMVAAGRWCDQVVVSSFSADALDVVRQTEPSVRLGLLVLPRAASDQALDHAARRGYDAVHPFCSDADAAMVELAHGYGLGVHVWAVNSDADLERMRVVAPDAVITDRVAAAVSVAAAPCR